MTKSFSIFCRQEEINQPTITDMDSQALNDSRDQIWDSSQEEDSKKDVEIQCDLDLDELAYRKKKADEMKQALKDAKIAQQVAEDKWEHREHVDALAAKYRQEKWDAANKRIDQLRNERDGLKQEVASLKKDLHMMDEARKALKVDHDETLKVVDSKTNQLSKAREELNQLKRQVQETENKVNEANTSNTAASRIIDNKRKNRESLHDVVHYIV